MGKDRGCWWVDFCRQDCTEPDCVDEGMCMDPPELIALQPVDQRLSWDEALCLPPRRPVETVDVDTAVL